MQFLCEYGNNIDVVQDGKFTCDGVILTKRSGGRISQSLLLSPSARFFALLRMTRDVFGQLRYIPNYKVNFVFRSLIRTFVPI